jgi:hypothetical protein
MAHIENYSTIYELFKNYPNHGFSSRKMPRKCPRVYATYLKAFAYCCGAFNFGSSEIGESDAFWPPAPKHLITQMINLSQIH